MKKIFMLCFFFQMLFCAEILLVDGTKLNGEIISSSDTVLQIKVAYSNDLLTINKTNILNIEFANTAEPNFVNTSRTKISDFSATARNIEKAGANLVAFQRQYYTGFFIQVVSSSMLFLTMNESAIPIAMVGGIMGTIMQLMSFSKVGVAGEELDEAAEELRKIEE
jgi:hypothetical protein